MNRAPMFAVAALLALLVTGVAHAQNPAGAQAGASTDTQAGANAQAGKSGTQASGSGSAAATANGSAQAGQNPVTLAGGSTMNATLANSLDAKTNKPGDRVEARTTQDVKQDGKVIIPKGTRLVGHVTQAQERAKGQSQSALGVAFDQAELRNGQTIPLNVGVQALAVGQSSEQASTAGDDLMAAGGGATSLAGSGSARGGGLVGGTVGAATGTVTNVAGPADGMVGGATGSTLNTATHSTGALGGLNASGMLTSNSEGVFGLQGLSLDSAASNATQGSMIVSSTRNVHLDSGTQMLLQTAAQATAQAN